MRAIFGLLLPRFQSVLPFFFGFFNSVSSLFFIYFSWKILLITLVNYNLQPSVFFISALSSSLKGMLFSCFDAIKLNFYFVCQIRLLLFISNGCVFKMNM